MNVSVHAQRMTSTNAPGLKMIWGNTMSEERMRELGLIETYHGEVGQYWCSINAAIDIPVALCDTS